MGGEGRVIVSIHDVAPPLLQEVRYLLDALDHAGVRPRALKVIPNLDGRHDARADPAFARMLVEEAAAGSEIVLHGYTHRVAGPLRGSGHARLRARLFAGPVAEFLTLSEAQMMDRLTRGRQILREIGVEPQGFCAPGWLAPERVQALLKRSGFRYYVSMLTLRDVVGGRALLTPWQGYMGAGAGQERMIRLGGRVVSTMAPFTPAMKVFFHPQGARESRDCAHMLRVAARLARSRQLVTFGSLVDQRP
jgi:predicted deacetylase